MKLTLILPDPPAIDMWPNGISCYEWTNDKWLARNWPPHIVEQMQKIGKVIVTKDYWSCYKTQAEAPKEGPPAGDEPEYKKTKRRRGRVLSPDKEDE